MDYSTYLSITLTALSVILTAMTIGIGIVAWVTIGSIQKKAKKIAIITVEAKLKELEDERILPFIKETILTKTNEQIEIMIKNGELREYTFQNERSVLNPETEKELEEKEE
ncbi:hypothetical protein [Commensalibacter nepenthis]|uniref:Uncharacterized protein n=1 Tax=Commensalibacter nepenthis TaxID=3043872 RepID=A0ABT6Q848_9PROT|nr:hypothetical protein [Commensalibacter sp. TBRC 10068]MDI2113079.1 hypothetical protein [Commensalibacter sp. TBRC 10068]